MPTTYVTAPDGERVPVTHPEGASQADIIAYAKKNYQPQQKEEGPGLYDLINGKVSATEMLDSIIDPVREFGAGAGLQLTDELEALARVVVDRIPNAADRIIENDPFIRNGKKYISWSDFKADIDAERKEYRRANPEMALGLEIAGGLMTGGYGLAKLGMGSTATQTALRSAGLAGTEGAIYGAGEGTTMEERIEKALKFGSLAAVSGGLLAGGMHKASEKLLEVGRGSITPAAMDIAEYTDDDLAEELYTRVAAQVVDARRSGMPAKDVKGVVQIVKAAEDMGIDPNKAIALKKKSAEKFNAIFDATDDELIQIDRGRHMHQANPEKETLMTVWARRVLQPIAGVVRDRIGESAAGFLKRSQLRAQTLVEDYTEGAFGRVLPIAERANSDLHFRGLMIDMANGSEKAGKMVRSYIKHNFGNDSLQAFEDWMQVNKSFASDYVKTMNARHGQTVDWLHTQVDKKKVASDAVLESPQLAKRAKDASAELRTRGMYLDGQVKPQEYINPFYSQLDWIHQHVPMMEFSKQWGLRPASVLPKYEKLSSGRDVFDPEKMKTVVARVRAAHKKGGAEAAKQVKAKEMARLRKEQLALEAEGARSTDYLILQAIPERMRKEGYSALQIEEMQAAAESLFVHGNKSANKAVRSLQNIGYASTLGNPYGAAMNLHDTFNTMAIRGIRNTIRGIAQRNNITVDDVGLARQVVGEYTYKMRKAAVENRWDAMAESSEDIVRQAFRYGQFERADRFGKNSILGSVVEEAKSNWPAAKAKWSRVFSPEDMRALERELASGTVGPKTKEMALMGLAEQQLISNTGRPQLWLNHPNGRIFYMLTGFAIKQANLLYDQVVRRMKVGDYKNAMKFLTRYMALSGTGYALVQESRQPLKGEMPDYSIGNMTKLIGQQMLAVSTLNRLGNDYSNEKFAQDPANYLLESLIPPLGLTAGAAKDLSQILQGDPVPDEMLKEMPVVGKTVFKPMFDWIEE